MLQFHNPPQSIALLCYIIPLLWPKQKYLFLLFICRNSHTSISVSIFGKRVSADWIFPCNWACLFGRKSHYTVSCYCIYPLYIKVHIQLFSSNNKFAVNFWIKVEMRSAGCAGKNLLTLLLFLFWPLIQLTQNDNNTQPWHPQSPGLPPQGHLHTLNLESWDLSFIP